MLLSIRESMPACICHFLFLRHNIFKSAKQNQEKREHTGWERSCCVLLYDMNYCIRCLNSFPCLLFLEVIHAREVFFFLLKFSALPGRHGRRDVMTSSLYQFMQLRGCDREVQGRQKFHTRYTVRESARIGEHWFGVLFCNL